MEKQTCNMFNITCNQKLELKQQSTLLPLFFAHKINKYKPRIVDSGVKVIILHITCGILSWFKLSGKKVDHFIESFKYSYILSKFTSSRNLF